MQFDKLIPVDLRSVWRNETSGFSTWLAKSENLNLLSNEIGIHLELIKREGLAGKFRVDILAKNSKNGDYVIIENQIEETNHSHLGQLITYSSHYKAKFIIWIVRDLRLEHEKAIEWLNANIGNEIKIFLVKIELFRIRSSSPAPKFTVISKPFGWTNKYFRKELELEPYPDEILKIEKLKKRVAKLTILEFFDKFIEIEKRYPRRELMESYAKQYPKDSEFYKIHKLQFKLDLIAWSEVNDYILNKDYQNEKSNGSCKVGGVEYFIISEKEF